MSFSVESLGTAWNQERGEFTYCYQSSSSFEFMTTVTDSLLDHRSVRCEYSPNGENNILRTYTFTVECPNENGNVFRIYRVTSVQNFLTTLSRSIGEGAVLHQISTEPDIAGQTCQLLQVFDETFEPA